MPSRKEDETPTDPLFVDILEALVVLRYSSQSLISSQAISDEISGHPSVVEKLLEDLIDSRPPLVEKFSNGFRITPNGTLQLKAWQNLKDQEGIEHHAKGTLAYDGACLIARNRHAYLLAISDGDKYLIGIVPFVYLVDKFNEYTYACVKNNIDSIISSLDAHYGLFGVDNNNEVPIKFW